MKITRKKHSDCLVDSCKHLSINQMAAGSRLLGNFGPVMDFFSFLKLFKLS